MRKNHEWEVGEKSTGELSVNGDHHQQSRYQWQWSKNIPLRELKGSYICGLRYPFGMMRSGPVNPAGRLDFISRNNFNEEFRFVWILKFTQSGWHHLLVVQ